MEKEKNEETTTEIAITYYSPKDLKKQNITLRKIAIIGLLASGISLSALIGIKLKREIHYNQEKNKIERLRDIADNFENTPNNEILVNNKSVNISNEMNEYIDAKEELNNARHQKESKEIISTLEQQAYAEGYDIKNISLQQAKDAASPYFEEYSPTLAHLEIYSPNTKSEPHTTFQLVGNNTQAVRNIDKHIIDSKEVNNTFVNAIVREDTDGMIQQIQSFTQEGLTEKNGKLK